MIEELIKICDVKENEKIQNTFKLDSICFAMVKPNNIDELIKVVEIIKKNKKKYIVLGNSSNVILPHYYDGVVIKLDNFNKYKVHDDYVETECGVQISVLSNKLVNMGYAGLDFACGIPGTIGGSVYGNAGCYGSCISEVLISANVFDGKNVIELSNDQINFEYRSSLFKKDKKKKYIMLSCKFKIWKDDVNKLKEAVKERMEKRIATQDLLHPSNGSVFRNPEGYSAGKLIDDLGLKGYSVNDAMVSMKHANFIINNKNATSEDIIKLIEYIKKEVKKEYNIDLVLEQEIIE